MYKRQAVFSSTVTSDKTTSVGALFAGTGGGVDELSESEPPQAVNSPIESAIVVAKIVFFSCIQVPLILLKT